MTATTTPLNLAQQAQVFADEAQIGSDIIGAAQTGLTQTLTVQSGQLVKITTAPGSNNEIVEFDTSDSKGHVTQVIDHYTGASNSTKPTTLADEVRASVGNGAATITAVDHLDNDNFKINVGNYSISTLAVSAAPGVDLSTATVATVAIGVTNSATGVVTALTGPGPATATQDKWTGSDGTVYQFEPFNTGVDPDLGSLEINQGLLGPGNDLLISNFDLSKAELDPNGYLSIKFKEQIALATVADLSISRHSMVQTTIVARRRRGNTTNVKEISTQNVDANKTNLDLRRQTSRAQAHPERFQDPRLSNGQSGRNGYRRLQRFCEQASAWLKATGNPSSSGTASFAAFSRALDRRYAK